MVRDDLASKHRNRAMVENRNTFVFWRRSETENRSFGGLLENLSVSDGLMGIRQQIRIGPAQQSEFVPEIFDFGLSNFKRARQSQKCRGADDALTARRFIEAASWAADGNVSDHKQQPLCIRLREMLVLNGDKRKVGKSRRRIYRPVVDARVSRLEQIFEIVL